MSKSLSTAFATHVAQTVTTLCWCWKLTRLDGVVFGFTDHDVDVTFDGIVYRGSTGLTASQLEGRSDYSVDNMEVSGAFSSDELTEADIVAGLYDGASFEIYRVNWAEPTQSVLIRKGWIGEVRRGKVAFQAEIRGLMQALNQSVGRSFCYLCDADVGDARCGIDITAATYTGTATVTAVTDNRRCTVSGLSGFANGWFGGGKLTWTSGANFGLSIEVKRHAKTSAAVTVEAWAAAPKDVVIGDTFAVTVGCDKSFATCKSKFGNGVNHRGFPYMIGNDAVVAYAYGDTDLDGGSRYGN